MARKLNYADLFSASQKSSKLRSGNWSERETLLLIAIWKDTKQDLKKTKRNRVVYEHMSKVLSIYNVSRSCHEIRRKVKNLSVQYRKEKLQAETTGNPSSWRYFARIDKILGNCPIIKPARKLELVTVKNEASEDENVMSNSESNDSDNEMLPLMPEILIPKNKKYNQRKRMSHEEDEESVEENKGTRNMLDIIENVLDECKVLREESKEINIKLVEVIEKQNQLLEKILEKL
ncbi:hypothetical protein NPIL_520431 [Nephila pilipes]|uniref:Myb/SANT-like DNA-binding domain-containing protein n=1 Tax=Nephila pilipes TaxID=299642 RepID=A0A8X6NC52_NEPPI|nr:hypothetical protein NPIL_520431 [Nephila pilipes]